jgi:endonuclease-3
MVTSELNIVKTIELLKKTQKGVRKTTLNREAKESKNFTPYETLISCLLSLRAKDETTEKISQELFKVANTPQKIIKLPQKKLEKIIYSSGYYKNKAKAIKRTSEQIIKDYGGDVPNTKEELIKLYGVGPKTANIVLCFAFGKVVIPVDTNVHRVANRLGWVKTKKFAFEATEKYLEKILPKKYWRDINGIFILHGKSICVPISPRCSICPIRKYCKRVGVKKSR